MLAVMLVSVSVVEEEAALAAMACEDLIGLSLPNTTITLAEIPADADYCKVAGYVDTEINFEVWMPVVGWNGKFNGVGNGGHCRGRGRGSLPARACHPAETGRHKGVYRGADVPAALPELCLISNKRAVRGGKSCLCQSPILRV